MDLSRPSRTWYSRLIGWIESYEEKIPALDIWIFCFPLNLRRSLPTSLHGSTNYSNCWFTKAKQPLLVTILPVFAAFGIVLTAYGSPVLQNISVTDIWFSCQFYTVLNIDWCSKPTRFFIVILMYDNVGCSASFEIRQKNVTGRTFIQGFYPWALTQPGLRTKNRGGRGGGDCCLIKVCSVIVCSLAC